MQTWLSCQKGKRFCFGPGMQCLSCCEEHRRLLLQQSAIELGVMRHAMCNGLYMYELYALASQGMRVTTRCAS